MALSAPVKVLLVVVYTAAVAAGAFGIGYAVFDSGDEDGGVAQGIQDGRIDELADSLLERIDRCPNELSRLTRLIGQALIGRLSGSDLERELRVLAGQYLACVATARPADGPSGPEVP